ncbi:MAG: FeS-binding protein [Pseudomonadota bacterium]
MSQNTASPGGRVARWLYGLAMGVAIFTGMAQMPIMKRYYIADIPGLAWTADYFVTSDLHYYAAALLLALLAWRVGLMIRAGGLGWSWGPRSAWGWTLLGLIAVTGLAKVARNAGVFVSPTLMVVLDLTHLGAAMAFMFTGIGLLFRRRGRAQQTEAVAGA